MTNLAVDLKPIVLDSLKQVARVNGACVSIYLPAYQQGSGAARPDVLLRSLSTLAEEQLLARGASKIDTEDLLKPVRAMSQDERLQRGRSESIALFRSPDTFEAFALPRPTRESVHVGATFHLLPAMELLASPIEFWVLALTRKGVRLLHGTSSVLKTAKLPASIPATLDEFLALEQPDHRRANRSAVGPSNGSMKGVAFGTGAETESQNRHFRDYCVAIDRGMRSLLEPDKAPLIVEGATAEVSIFRSASQYSYLATPIVRSPDDGVLSDDDLNSRVRAQLSQNPTPAESRAQEYVSAALGTNLAVTELSALVRLASKGRVDVTFLCSGAAQRADVDHITGKVRLAGEFQAKDDDLFNAAAIETLLHSGEVWVVPAERIPGGGAAVARLRY